MTGPVRQVAAARMRTAAASTWRAELRGVLILDAQGAPERVVVAFADEAAARSWAEAHQVGAYRIVPAELAEPSW
ncbi:hypothetical protein UG55_103523 [Frankia sp. EI5c]|nr:hypothetical protein UG55_103523 [Frankia sp. EI5c]